MTFEKPKTDRPRALTDYLSDARVIQVIIQIVFITLLVAVLSIVWVNVLGTLTERRISTSLDVLSPIAGFQVGEAPPWYDQTSTFGEAFQVGVINTLRVVSVGLVLSTILGVLVGIFLLSRNWLIRTISKVYVEILRNTPLLVQLYFWYFIVFFSLPVYRDLISFPQAGYTAIPYRYLWYAVILVVLYFYARRVGFLYWLMSGAAASIVVLEFALALARSGGQVPIGLVLVAILCALVVASLRFLRNRGQYLWLTGFGIAGLVAIVLAERLIGLGTLGTRSDLVILGGLTFVMGLIFLFTTERWHYMALAFVGLVGSTVILSILIQFSISLKLPFFSTADAAVTQVYPALFASNKGLAFPTIDFTARFGVWAAFIAAGVALAIAVWQYSGHVTETTGRPIARGRLAVLSIVGAALIGWIAITAQPVPDTITFQVGDQAVTQPYDQALMDSRIPETEEREEAWYPIKLVMPEQGKNNYTRGTIITPEYAALLVGLVVYTSAFIAEIVRAGIQAVPYGQIEAARALGLSYSETLSLIILPQALRVIIPPLGNQYLNLAKNSSLAIAVAFADVYQVGLIFMNTSGQSLVAFTVIFLVYITMSLTISFVMNIANSYFQIVTR